MSYIDQIKDNIKSVSNTNEYLYIIIYKMMEEVYYTLTLDREDKYFDLENYTDYQAQQFIEKYYDEIVKTANKMYTDYSDSLIEIKLLKNEHFIDYMDNILSLCYMRNVTFQKPK